MKTYIKQLWISAYGLLASCLGLNNPYSHLILCQWYKRKLKAVIARNGDAAAINRVRDRFLFHCQAYAKHKPDLDALPDWIEVNRSLAGQFLFKGDSARYNEICQRVSEVQASVAEEHQMDKLNLRFIPRSLAEGSIGVFEFLEVYLKAQRLGYCPAGELVLLVDPKSKITNPCYLNYWSRHVTVISDPELIRILTPLEKALAIPVAFYMALQEKVVTSRAALGIIREQWLKEALRPILILTDEDKKRGWDVMRALGLPDDAWFVCLHVRERGWKGEFNAQQDYRNADIDTYLDAVKAVTEAGGWVFRMGDAGNSRTLPEMPNVIDYAHSDVKSDEMDIFLSAECRFFIGSSSGLYTVAMAFGRPVAMTNLLPACAAYYLSNKDIFIPRMLRFKDGNRLADFVELLTPPLALLEGQSNFEERNIGIINNDADDIKGLVAEMIRRCDGVTAPNRGEERLQQRFQKIYADRGKHYGNSRLAAHARISGKFLKKYKGLLGPEDISADHDPFENESHERTTIH